MYCPFCGTDNPEDRKFCLACGTPLELENKTHTNDQEKQKDLHLKIVRQPESLETKTENQKEVAKKIERKEQSVSQDSSNPVDTTSPTKTAHSIVRAEDSTEQAVKDPGKPVSPQLDRQPAKQKKHVIERKVIEQIPEKPVLKELREAKPADLPKEESKQHEHKITRKIELEHDVREQAEQEMEVSTPKNLYKNVSDTKPKITPTMPVTPEDQEESQETGHDWDKRLGPPITLPKPEAALENKLVTPPVKKEENKDPLKKSLSNKAEVKKSPEKIETSQETKKVKVEKEVQLIGSEEKTKRSVLLGEDDSFSDEQEFGLFGLPKKKLRIIMIAAAAWVLLVVFGSIIYLSSNSTPQTPSGPTQEVVLNDVSDLKVKLTSGVMELAWIWNTNEVKIVDQILEIYDLSGNLVKQVNLGPDLFGYELSGLERGVEYRVVLKLKSEDGRLSGGKNILVTIPFNYDTTRKQDLEELKSVIETYFEAKGYYPKSQNYASLLNTLIKEKLIKRRIKDPEAPEHQYEYKSMWEGQSYELKIYLSNPEDELFGNRAPKDQLYIYNPANEKSALEALRAEE
ncbi:MAG: zinc-ribbon domain-containing protein [Candidatus Gracilibacteria bacterium]|nr:zinc-ribbon domain-containing protein [Candidatus Gracilibacteria bacterium]